MHPGLKCLKILARSVRLDALTVALQVTARTATAGETATRFAPKPVSVLFAMLAAAALFVDLAVVLARSEVMLST